MSTNTKPVEEKNEIFWSDEVAAELGKRVDKTGRPVVISTGITPSGEIHVGHLREMVTAHAVCLSAQQAGIPVDFNYVMDNLDPLRKVYPFLDPKVYEPHVGCPIGKIPGPAMNGKSYADHFAEPFLASLSELGMKPRVVRADQEYLSDAFIDVILRALRGRDRIGQILNEMTGKQISADWNPFNPICNQCHRLSDTIVTGFSESKLTVSYRCKCGDVGEVPVRGGGKLTWRVDWPARWKVLGVTMEPFGKDHATAGGSYDTGSRISREIFENEPPYPMMYEWIGLVGMGDMSSSKGNVVSIHEMLQVVPGDVLRYFVLKSRPGKRLNFDPGLPLLNVIDEYDTVSEAAGNRAIDLARVGSAKKLGVPFRHLVTIYQICGDTDLKKIQDKLAQTGYAEVDAEQLKRRLAYVKNWLNKFAPEEVKFSVQDPLPAAVSKLTALQKQALHEIAAGLTPNMDGEAIHKLVYSLKDKLGAAPADLFKAVYIAILGQERGPRVGAFLAALDHQFVVKRLSEV